MNGNNSQAVLDILARFRVVRKDSNLIAHSIAREVIFRLRRYPIVSLNPVPVAKTVGDRPQQQAIVWNNRVPR
jgi:hypothetical protein